jgi:hypothetical protein
VNEKASRADWWPRKKRVCSSGSQRSATEWIKPISTNWMERLQLEFWGRMNAEWLEQDQQVQFALAELRQANEPAQQLTASRTLE